jgi:hypothetical protein
MIAAPEAGTISAFCSSSSFISGSGSTSASKTTLELQMIKILTDTKDQPYIEWPQAKHPAGYKRAWIQRKTDPTKDWAGTGRYLNVVRIDSSRPGSGGNPTDFPIFSGLPDEQVLEAFVAAVCAVTGCKLP